MSLTRSPMTFVMLAIFVAMVGVASTYPGDARFMPFVVGIPAIALCLLQLVLDHRASAAPDVADDRTEMQKAEDRVSQMVGRHLDFEVAHAAPDVTIIENSDEVSHSREFIIWGYVLGFIAAILVFGFWVSIPAFIAIFLNREAHYGPAKAAIYAAVGGGLMFAIFNYGLKLKLHPGFIADFLF